MDQTTRDAIASSEVDALRTENARLRACIAEVRGLARFEADGAAGWDNAHDRGVAKHAAATLAILDLHAPVNPDHATTQQVSYRDADGRKVTR